MSLKLCLPRAGDAIHPASGLVHETSHTPININPLYLQIVVEINRKSEKSHQKSGKPLLKSRNFEITYGILVVVDPSSNSNAVMRTSNMR